MTTKLNLGCGANHLDGYINIDIRLPKMKEPDYVCDIVKLPYKENMIDEIVAYHSFEHLSKPDAFKAVSSWLKMLRPEGKLVIECPDILMLCKKVAEGEIQYIDNIYGLGRQPYDFHKYGWTGSTLSSLLLSVGYVNVTNEMPTDYHSTQEPCFRVVAYKK
jgi:predicted SAM-dependent methyltransferase